jgi:phosphoglycolate phosphatase
MNPVAHIRWDWNGTLLQDAELGRSIMNGMLARRQLPLLTRERYREILTFPIIEYYRMAGIDLARESFDTLAVEYVAAYEAGWRACTLEPGVEDVVRRAADAGITQSILSANRHDRLLEQLRYYGLTDFFVRIEGISDDLAYGKEHLAQGHMASLGVPADSAVYIGDTLHDAQSAQAMGCRCVLVSWGHQSEARLAAAGVPLCRQPGELIPLLGL